MSSADFIRQNFFHSHVRFIANGKMYQGIFFPDQDNAARGSSSLFTFVPTANLRKWRAAKEASAGITQLLLSVMVDVEQSMT